jgi:hypothetical protein
VDKHRLSLLETGCDSTANTRQTLDQSRRNTYLRELWTRALNALIRHRPTRDSKLELVDHDTDQETPDVSLSRVIWKLFP